MRHVIWIGRRRSGDKRIELYGQSRQIAVMKFVRILPLIGTALMAVCPVSAESRVWTNKDGKTLTASLFDADQHKVVLKQDGTGRQFQVPLSQLTAEDVGVVKAWLATKAQTEKASRPGGLNAPWPSLVLADVTPEIEVVEENAEKKQYVYRSPRYEYVSDAKLGANVVKRFAVLFEATNEFVSQLPLGMEKAHQEKRHLIMLYETQNDYLKHGGIPKSAGVYKSRGDVILVPLTSLGVIESAGGYRVDYGASNQTLSHEIAHQLTDLVYYCPGSVGWFTEGLAEYIAATPYRSGKFNLRTNQAAVKDFVAGYGKDNQGGRALGTQIHVRDFKSYLLMDYSDFFANANFNYGVALLLTYYFFHFDGKGDAANIKAYLKAIKEGKTGESALEVLRAGRTYEQLAKDISTAWRARGITIQFN